MLTAEEQIRRWEQDPFRPFRWLIITGMHIETLPELPSDVETLLLDTVGIQTLCGLPPTLQRLTVRNCPRLSHIGYFPSSLTEIGVKSCNILWELPTFPSQLHALVLLDLPRLVRIKNLPVMRNGPLLQGLTLISKCPGLPSNLSGIIRVGMPWYCENIESVMTESKHRQIQRCRTFKEALMMVCWHPSRVERYLEMGREDLIFDI